MLCISGMTGIKEWLQNRFGAIDLLQAVNKTPDNKHQIPPPRLGIITPQTVPDFVIPCRDHTSLRMTRSFNGVEDGNNNNSSAACSNKNSLKGTKSLQTTSVTGFQVRRQFLVYHQLYSSILAILLSLHKHF